MSRSALTTLLAAALGWIAIILWLIDLRADLLSPEWSPIFLSLFVFQDYTAALLGLLTLILALIPAVQRAGLSLTTLMGERPAATAIVSGVLFAAAAVFAFHRHPLSMDEYASLFQSEIFAAGHLTGRLPPALLDWLVPAEFQDFFINVSRDSGEVASAYWPGFALILTPFTLVSVPWLCNALLGAFTLLVVHRAARELFGNVQVAGFAVLFTLASTAFTTNAASYYSMTAHLLCNSLYFLLMLRPTARRMFLAGAIGSIALTLHNPVPHALFALPWVCWLASRRDRLPLLASLAAGYLPLCLLLGWGWTAAMAPLAGAESVGTLAGGVPASPMERLASVLAMPGESLLFARLIGLAKIWLWAVPGLVVLAFVGLWRWRSDVRLRMLAWSAVATLLGYLFVPFDQGHGWGFRYFHSAWIVLPILGAAALAQRPGARPRDASESDLAGIAAAWAVLSLIFATALRLYQVEDFVSKHLAQVPVAREGTSRVVIVTPSMGYYAADLVQNDPFLRGERIVMVSRGRARDRQMMQEQFPELQLLHKDYKGQVWGTKP